MVNCSAVNCSNRTEKNFRMYRFRKEKLRRKIWINNCSRDKWEPTESACLCEIHFEKSQFEWNRGDNKIKLKPNAIPTVFNVLNPPQRIDSMAIDTCRTKTAVRRICSEIINSPPPAKILCVCEEPAVAGEIILPSHSRDFDPRQSFEKAEFGFVRKKKL